MASKATKAKTAAAAATAAAAEPTKAKTAPTGNPGAAFVADFTQTITGTYRETLAAVTDPAKIEQATAAIADLARITATAKMFPEQAPALRAEAAFPLSTLASITGQTTAQVGEAWREAAWQTAQKAAHFLAAFAVA